MGQISNFKFQIFLFLVFAICFLIFNISPASAQSQNPHLNPNTNPDVPKNLHTWTQNVMIEVMSAMACQLTGIDPTNPKAQCLGVDPKTGNIGYVEGGGGAIGVAGKMIGMLYTPPLHTGDYFKYLASNFGIAKPAQAATGFEGLKPIQSLWVAFRNIVYLLFVIIFIVIGLAIMLRVRIDPRTVMTIQNQIPKIIIGILLVTFSFAIAGFLIDLMYVVIFLSYEVIVSSGVTDFTDLNPFNLQKATPFGAADKIKNWGASGVGLYGISFEAAKAIYSIIGNMFGSFIADTLGLFFDNSIIKTIVEIPLALIFPPITLPAFIIDKIFSIGIFDSILKILGLGASAGISKVVGFVAGLIAFFIIGIALLITLIRLWFTLIMAYVSILLNVVFAPFWIAGALLPGSPIGFGAWLRSIIANLAAFPATIIMFLLAKAFIDGIGKCKLPTCDPNTVFVPPLVGDLPGTDSIGAIIALGIILMTPNVVTMVRAALKAPSLPAAGILAGIAAGGRVVGGVPRGIVGTHMAGEEYIAGAQGFEQRGTRRALLGRLFGR